MNLFRVKHLKSLPGCPAVSSYCFSQLFGLPIIAIKAWNNFVSSCLPSSSCINLSAGKVARASRYDLFVVRASKMSAIVQIHAKCEICLPANPSGYPEPSIFSWWCRTMSKANLPSPPGLLRSSNPCAGCVFMISHCLSFNSLLPWCLPDGFFASTGVFLLFIAWLFAKQYGYL